MTATEQGLFVEEGYEIQSKAPEKASKWTKSLEYYIIDTVHSTTVGTTINLNAQHWFSE